MSYANFEVIFSSQILINTEEEIGVSNNIVLNVTDFASVSLICIIDGANKIMTQMTATRHHLSCSGLLQYFDPSHTRVWQNYKERCREIIRIKTEHDREYFNISAETLDLDETGLQAACDYFLLDV